MAAYNVDIDNIDLTWDNILKVYPESVIPSKLKKRTGKAQKALFEEIDNNLYEKEARMITFHTHVNRIYPWIKTLSTLFIISIWASNLNTESSGLMIRRNGKTFQVRFPLLLK